MFIHRFDMFSCRPRSIQYLFSINVSQLQIMVMTTVPATASPSKRRSTSCSEFSELYILHLVFDICYILFQYIVQNFAIQVSAKQRPMQSCFKLQNSFVYHHLHIANHKVFCVYWHHIRKVPNIVCISLLLAAYINTKL